MFIWKNAPNRLLGDFYLPKPIPKTNHKFPVASLDTTSSLQRQHTDHQDNIFGFGYNTSSHHKYQHMNNLQVEVEH